MKAIYWLLSFSLVLLFIHEGLGECKNNKKSGHDSTICVCTEAQPCEKLDQPTKTAAGIVTRWHTDRAGARFNRDTLNFTKGDVSIANPQLHIKVDRTKKNQEILGFGGSFTDATGINFKKLGAKLEDAMVRDCFSKDGLEYNIGRIPIGGSDFSTRGYSYDDGAVDLSLNNWKLQTEDLELKIPFIQKAKSLATHEIRLYGSPWSAPAWMKDNAKLIQCGVIKGKVGEEYWQAYAKYFIKYLEAYKEHNISHWGITVQNEPYACQTWNSMWFSPESMAEFTGKVLGPVLEKAGYGPDKLKIMMLDHNVGLVKEWVSKYYADAAASKYTAGTAIHWYGHDPKEQLDGPHDQHPDKFMLATEACVEGGMKLGDWNTAYLYSTDILSDLLHHVIGWTDWNMALDTQGGPNWVKNYVDAPLVVDEAAKAYYRQPSFYAMAHFSKFLPPGSIRVDTQQIAKSLSKLLVGAFTTPNGSTVVIAINSEDQDANFEIDDDKFGKLSTKLPAHSIQTYVYYD